MEIKKIFKNYGVVILYNNINKVHFELSYHYGYPREIAIKFNKWRNFHPLEDNKPYMIKIHEKTSSKIISQYAHDAIGFVESL